MIHDKYFKIVQVAYDELFRVLPAELASKLEPLWKNVDGEPDYIPHMPHWRVRIVPKLRTPKGFWAAGWCFYELGAGAYHGSSDRSQVQFFMAGNQKVCSDRKYNAAVDSILSGVAKRTPGSKHLSIFRNKYSQLMIRNVDASPKKMALGLAQIIKHTLHKFQALEVAPQV